MKTAPAFSVNESSVAGHGRNRDSDHDRRLDAPKQPNEAQRNQRHANEVNESVRLVLMKLLVTGDQSVQFFHIGQVAA